MLAKDVGRMSKQDLAAFVRNLIVEREAESVRLDYKQTLDLRGDKGRKELAKDISALANTEGGMVVYGVPETEGEDLPRPKPLPECGMNINTDLHMQVVNILMSAVQPALHALTVEVVEIEDIRPNKVLVVYHPESYWKPHMVEGYGDQRYYKRVPCRIFRMTEREVQVAYQAREDARRHAADFFQTASLGPIYGQQIRAVVCPVTPGKFKERMLQQGFQEWLEANKPMGPSNPRAGDWLPFLDGWRFLGRPPGAISGKQYEIRVFHNGAVCLNLDPGAFSTANGMGHCIVPGFLLLDEIEHKLRHLFVDFSSTVFSEFAIGGPVVVQVSILQAHGLKAVSDIQEYDEMKGIKDAIAQEGVAVIDRVRIRAAPELGQPYVDANDLVFEEESSAEEIIQDPQNIVDRLIVRLETAFGRWKTAEDET